MGWGWESYGDYVSADEKRQRAGAAARKLETKGRKLSPVLLAGRSIASSFWGKAWCQNLESYSDYASRLPRGRSYLRQGAVLDLQVNRATIKAVVSGTRLYEVEIRIDSLAKAAWTRLKKECSGKVGSLMDLLQGKLSGPVMEIVTRKHTGLFPEPGKIHLECSCPDYAGLCKHIAAVLYGVGARLDQSPELLFVLRGVDHLELIASATQSVKSDLTAPAADRATTLDESSLTEIFGIDLDTAAGSATASPSKRTGPGKRAASKAAKSPGRARKRPAPAPSKRTPGAKPAAPAKKPVRTAKKASKKKSVPVSQSARKRRRPATTP